MPHTLVVVFKTWQDQTFQDELMDAIARQIHDTTGRPFNFNAPLAFDEFLARAIKQTERSLLIILDQFEEYFLYHPNDDPFDESFARAVNRGDLNANFLLSLREDALSQLDRFETRIPNLMSNYLRLEHLNRDGAINAIRKPLDVYNAKLASEPPSAIEDALVDALIQQVQTGRVMLGQRVGHGAVTIAAPIDTRDVRIETPFLQMVLTRLWDEEIKVGSHNLKLETLNHLGGAEKIVRTHLDAVMKKLAPSEQEVCSSFFDRLVTPSGTKIAQTADDLVTYAARPAERVKPVLKKLADARVLRPIAPPMDQPQTARYEIFHDVLAPGILDWRGRYAERKRTRRWRLIFLGTAFIALVILVLAIVTINANTRAISAEAEAQYLHKQAHMAESRRLAIQSAIHRDKNYSLALLLGIEAHRSDDNLETRANLLDSLVGKAQLTTELRASGNRISSLALSSDELVLASGSSGAPGTIIDKPLVVWDLRTQPIGSIPLIDNGLGVHAVAFHPDEQILASGSEDGTITLWDYATQQPIGEVLLGHKLQVNSLSFSPDGKILASGSEDGTIIFWDVSTHKPIDQPVIGSARGAVKCVAFSPDGNTLASGNVDGTIILWDASSHHPIGQHLVGHKDWVLSLAFSPDGEILASGGGNLNASKDNTIILWNVNSHQPIGQPFIGHRNSIWSIVFDPGGQVLVSASQDKTIIIWDVNSHVPLLQPLVMHQDTVSSLTGKADGFLLVSGSWDGTILLWDTNLDSWIARACKLANRNITVEEWKQYVNPDESTYHVTCPDLPSPK